jgi:predicted SAM-dependent methyltransferase
MFMEEGFAEATGITCSREDAHEANERGMRNVCVLDMHEIGDLRDEFVPQKVGELDLVWARHVLEHSPIPLFVLQEIHSILRPGTGKLYVEVPDPATACHHCANVQHFSCFGREGWEGLFDKAGFTPLDTFVFNVQVKAGDDRYFCWLLGLK